MKFPSEKDSEREKSFWVHCAIIASVKEGILAKHYNTTCVVNVISKMTPLFVLSGSKMELILKNLTLKHFSFYGYWQFHWLTRLCNYHIHTTIRLIHLQGSRQIVKCRNESNLFETDLSSSTRSNRSNPNIAHVHVFLFLVIAVELQFFNCQLSKKREQRHLKATVSAYKSF